MKTSKISAASTVIMFLSEYIHGEVNGKREDLKERSLENAFDAIVRLYPHAKFIRPVRQVWCAECKTPNFCQNNIDKPCVIKV